MQQVQLCLSHYVQAESRRADSSERPLYKRPRVSSNEKCETSARHTRISQPPHQGTSTGTTDAAVGLGRHIERAIQGWRRRTNRGWTKRDANAITSFDTWGRNQMSKRRKKKSKRQRKNKTIECTVAQPRQIRAAPKRRGNASTCDG